MKKNSMQRLFEVMGRLDKTFNPVNEFDNYNYPVGADADPKAPWHQTDVNIQNIEVNYDKRYPYTFSIDVLNNKGGYYSFDGFDLVEKSQNPEIRQFFDKFQDTELSFDVVNSPEFVNMAKKLFDETIVNLNDVEWEYDESIDEEINPHYQIGTQEATINKVRDDLNRLLQYLDQNPTTESVKGFVQGILNNL